MTITPSHMAFSKVLGPHAPDSATAVAALTDGMQQHPHWREPQDHPLHPSKLHVLIPISNPARFKIRPQLCREFLARMEQRYGCTVWLIEAATGDRNYEVAEPEHPRHIRVRCDHLLWIKEAMLQAALRHLPPDAEYVAWLDSDIEFVRADWVTETLHQLQIYDVVQMFSHAVDLGPDHEIMATHQGFAYLYDKGLSPIKDAKAYAHMHPGYAWAWRLDKLNKVGGFITTAILGAGDRHMAYGLVGVPELSIQTGVTAAYAKPVMRWGQLAEQHIQRNIGHVKGTIHHYFHGWKADRRYHDRWQILIANQFDPEVDLVWNHQGMPMLAGNKPKLRDDIRRYFFQRNEDVRH